MYRSIMVPLDGSTFGEYALPLALGIARQAGATVHLTHVWVPPAPIYTDEMFVVKDMPHLPDRERERTYLNELAMCLSERWEVAITPTLLDGPVSDTLRAHALATDVDLIVVTTHGRGPLSRFWLGSVTDALIRQMPIPILLVRPHEAALDLLEEVHEQAFQHVLIPLDGSALAEEVVESAVALGRLMQAEYTLLQAIDVPLLGYAPAAHATGMDEQIREQWRAEAQTYLDQVAEGMRAEGLKVHTSVKIAQPAVAILDYARENAVDLIAMATHGRGGVARLLLGSVADKVVRGAGAPVLLLRPQVESTLLKAAGSEYANEDFDIED